MTNYIKIDMKPNHSSNYSYKHSNLSINNMNLSFMNSISSPINQMKDFAAASITLGFLFSDVTPVITHFLTHRSKVIKPFIRIFGLACHRLSSNNFGINRFTTDDNKRYYGFTTNCSAAKPSRHSLAIFMSKICLTNYQRFTNDINTNISALQTSHKYSTDTIGANIYDGLSGPNKIPLVGNKPRRLNTVVNNLSPFFVGGNKLTKCSGAIRNG